MTDAFETLGIESCLTISDESLRTSFREAGKASHPDAGGGDDEFAKLREAFDILSSPSRRLKHWLELRGTPVETRGAVDPSLMELFAVVGEISQRAEALIRKRDETKSALGLAMLERETQSCREAIEKTLRLVEGEIQSGCSVFPEIERSAGPDPDSLARTVRNLAFLEKWRTGLRGIFARLI